MFYKIILIGPIVLFFVISLIRMLLLQHKLHHYLLHKHPDKWKNATSIGGLGHGYATGPKGLRDIFSIDDTAEPEFRLLKIKFRNSIIYTFTSMFAIFVVYFLSTAISVIMK